MKKIYTISFTLQTVLCESKPIYYIKINRIRMTCEITQLSLWWIFRIMILESLHTFHSIDRGGQLKNQKLENQKNAKRTA